ncbi:MAG: hypothetical protein B6229_06125 [Spirochaetaceae bacterium 4572_7]|nr:MAG: hypothetical protein B6229_06125 [Spirochaetaceae bacterium 4572_7]
MTKEHKFNLKLEQHILGELPKKESLAIEQNFSNNEYIEYINNSNQAFFEKFNLNKLVVDTEEKLNATKPIKIFPIKRLSTVLAMAACFFLIIRVLPMNRTTDDIYLKGAERLNIYIQNGSEVEKLKNLSYASEMDKLQITYMSKEKYGTIFSIDGLHNTTFHHPGDGIGNINLEQGKEIFIPSSYTLDNAPFFEKFYFISTDKSFNLTEIKKAISRINIENGSITSDIQLPSQYNIKTITLIKD